ncbi:MAG TPA: Clp protease N-terminal domain-containing protein [Hyphomicrobium sp.]|nr:Clp protease N-terminal domain-containing protein [Hyphomicrobium sp.]
MTDLAVADLSHIPVSQGLAATLARASEGARATGAREVSLEHILAALCDDSDAADVLAASHIDSARLKSETIAYLAHADDGAGGPLPARGQIAVSAPLMRILEAAAAAARGGRRRDINGAIVLAAIVGDGGSVAAQLLQKHGLTFEGAIRALQAALAQPSRNDAPAMTPAEDVLARARERVQSRAAPSLRDIMFEKGQAPQSQPAAPAPGDITDLAAPHGPLPEPVPAPPPSTVDLPAPALNPPDEPGVADEPTAPSQPSLPAGQQHNASAKAQFEPANLEAPPAGPGAGQRANQEPGQPESARASSAASPQHGRPNWLPPVEGPPQGPPSPPPWVQTGAGPSSSPGASAPFPAPQAPANAGQGVRDGRSTAPAAPNALPVPPGFEVRRTGGPQPPPIPPPMPKGPPHHGGSGAQPAARSPLPPLGVPPGMPPQGPPGGKPGMPAARPQGAHPGGPRGAAPPPGMSAPGRAPAPTRARETAREPATAEPGQLTENIPRAMRVGMTERVEIRIGRAHIKNMAEGMEGGGLAWKHDVTVTKAMSVRMRAPEGGFFVETASPETQWIDNQFDEAGNDFASWRFLITPQQRGWATLRITVSARTVGTEGVVAETAFPDQVIEVKVRTNYGRTAKRMLGWLAAAVAGGVLAKFGEGAFDIGSGLISRLLG